MERVEKESKITWTHLMLFGGAFFRQMMKDAGYFLEEGIVLVLDNELQAKQFVSNLTFLSDGVFQSTNNWKQRKKPDILNYCGCFFIISKRTNDDEIEDFLSEKNFFPLVVCGGVIPTCIQFHPYIFRLGKEDLLKVHSREFEQELHKWKEFIIQNSNVVYRTILDMKRSIAIERAENFEEYKVAFSFFSCIGKVYALYLSTYKTEREVISFFDDFLEESQKKIEKFREFQTSDQIQETFSERVWDYVSLHPEVMIVDAENVNGSAYDAIQKKQAILFDLQHYYFSCELFENICKPLLATVSVPELKLRMSKMGILSCNSVDYTVKKQIVTVYGTKERIRVLRIKKEMLLSEDNLFLENVYCDLMI